jgi:peptidoglycan/xylan/chitin deacetylase (PgdA/CDA1 family)
MISLLYHDVVPGDDLSVSGFGGRGAGRYKLTSQEFEQHLAAIARVMGERKLTALDARALRGDPKPVYLTFDDGGMSAHAVTADLLERRGWRGTFFITTDYIGVPKFLDASQIRDLRKRGHSIGTHSCSHPALMARRPYSQLHREWKESAARLADIIGESIVLASVPGGFYGRNVAVAAAECGIQALFTSEPVASVENVDGCLVSGRYTIHRRDGAATAGRIAGGEGWLRFLHYCHWRSTRLMQSVGGIYYHRLRRAWLEGPSHQ